MKLTEKPFYLDDEAIAWVEDTLEILTLEDYFSDREMQ